jgi:xyloglucan galactosyltransferase MUR3
MWQMLVWLVVPSLLAMASLAVRGASPSEGKYFYIYDWPEALQDVYPPPGAVLAPKSAYSHDFYDNNGAGKLIEPNLGMFATWQFSLFKNVMSRLRVSEYRTLDPLKASAFIVPYDAGAHSTMDHLDGRDRLASPHGWTALKLLKEASTTASWRLGGHDHFVLFSITGYHYVGIGTKNFFMTVCQNCTVLTIETTPATIGIPGRSLKHWYAVPYPSSFHWYEGLKQRPWLPRRLEERNIVAIFIGSIKTATPSSNALRRALFGECSHRPDSECQWHLTAHSCTGVLNQSSAMLLYRQAKFCLAPTGDSLTRKSLFDSYLSGCVPVIFAKASLTQYSWHLSEQEINQTTVYIPKNEILQGQSSFMDRLLAISDQELRLKQEAIARIAPRLQYSVVPPQWRDSTQGLSWAPPERDATDVIIERILDRRTIEPVAGYTAEQIQKMQTAQNVLMTTDPDYMGSGSPGTPQKRKQELKKQKREEERDGKKDED